MRIFSFMLLTLLAASFFTNDTLAQSKQKYTISGHINDAATGEELIGASVFAPALKAGTITNVYGFYSLTLEQGDYEIIYSYLGYEDLTKKISLQSNQRLNISLSPAAEMLDAVEIRGEKKNQNVEKVEMSVAKLSMKTIKKLPAMMGEVDIIKNIQLLPGVQSAGEGSSSFSVRGGGIDQNLIMLDDATVYNASHFGGFLSVFNSDAIKDVKLYKGGIPAEYGGRLSSILDIRMKDGNSKKLAGAGGIGLLSSRLTLEGPLKKDVSSFIISGRRTYADILFMPFLNEQARESKFYFYDFNAKANYRINENNRLYLSGYFGRDVSGFSDVMRIDYGNKTGNLRWNHIFNDKLFLNTTFIYSNYQYNLHSGMGGGEMDWNSHIIDYSVKTDFNYFLNSNNTLKFGMMSTYHDLEPGVIALGTGSSKRETNLPDNFALEHAVYVQNEQKISGVFSLIYGLRFSAFENIGSASYYEYDKSDPKTYAVSDTINHARGDIFNVYSGFEPRFGMKYSLDENSSLKASYNRMRQYLHLARNSTTSTPLDVWFMSSPNIKPQLADQVALGYFRNIKQDTYETSVEVYYKKMHNTIDFKDHAELLLNDKFEGEVRVGEAESYGAEFQIKKQEGKLTGWLSYTLARTMFDIPDNNFGKKYLAAYDKTHDISVVLSYDISKRINVSASWVYSTASPVTVPVGRYEFGNLVNAYYSDRNSVRLFDYHRLDLSVTLYGKKTKKYESSWNFSVYNAYNRHNTYSIDFRSATDNPYKTIAEKTYLFSVLPSITYNFKF